MRKVLFIKMVTLKLADLPRWRPTIIITQQDIDRYKQAEDKDGQNS
jgi:hypothetical protein